MAILFNADGTFGEVKPQNGQWFTLQEKQQLVQGIIEFCETNNDE